jgi:hypothetical protein
MGGSSVLLLAFSVTCISRYIPPSSCIFDNGRQSIPTLPSPVPVQDLKGQSSASFLSCADHNAKTPYIIFAVAAAVCGYVSSLHGLCMYSLVSNYPSIAQKDAFMKRVHSMFVSGVFAFFVGVLLLFLTLAHVGYGVQTSRVTVTAVSSTGTKSEPDTSTADATFYVCAGLGCVLLYGISRLRQAVVLGNSKSQQVEYSVSADEVVEGSREFNLAVSRSNAASSDANIVCGFILYNIVTFGTDIGSLTTETAQAQFQLGFLLVNVLACAMALVSVVWGLFINVWSSVSDSVIFRFYFIIRAKTITKLAYYMFLVALNLMIVTMAMFGKAKYSTPASINDRPAIVPNPAPLTPDDSTIAYKEL